jgi:hypothetical protein
LILIAILVSPPSSQWNEIDLTLRLAMDCITGINLVMDREKLHQITFRREEDEVKRVL